MASNLVTLDEIIDGIEFTDNEAQYGHHLNKPKKRFIGLKAIRELNLDVARAIKGKKIKLRSNGTIELPDDYMDYVGIFILSDTNHLLPLGKNKMINISNEPILDHNYIPILDHNGSEIYDSRDASNSFSTQPNTTAFQTQYPLNTQSGFYGIGGGRNMHGYYRVDYEDNTIQFDIAQEHEYIYLEYISNGLEGVNSSRVMVPVQIADAVVAYIMWNMARYQRGVAANEKLKLEQDFYNEKRKARRRMSKFIAEEARQSTRMWTQQTPKY